MHAPTLGKYIGYGWKTGVVPYEKGPNNHVLSAAIIDLSGKSHKSGAHYCPGSQHLTEG